MTENSRFNGYNESELDGLIKEILESDEKLNKLINIIINKIDFEQLSNNDYELLLTKSYKKFILDFFSKEIAKKYNLEKDISNAISGKIFRENFTKISSKIYELLIEKKLEKIITNNLEEITKKSEETLFLQHFDLSNDHISKKISSNIKDIYLLIIFKLKKEIQILIQKKYNINGDISNTLFNLLTKKILDKKINKIKEKLIKKLVDSLIRSISKNPHKLEQTTLDFLRYLSINEIQIKVQYIQNELDALKISSDIKVFLGYIKKIKNELKEKKEKLDKIKKETQSLSNQKAKNEIDLLENKRTINKYFNNIGFKSKSYDQISIFEVMSELKKSKNNKNNIIEEVNDSSSNKIKSVINSKKIQENKEKIKKYGKRIKLLEEIIELMQKNRKIEAKLLKLKNLKEKELNVNKGIISQEKELEVFYDKIEQIKDGLFNTLIK